MPLILTADLGNSALKLLLWDSGPDAGRERVLQRLVISRGGDLREGLSGALASFGPIEAAALASVASPEAERSVREALRAALSERAELCSDPGVENSSGEPRTTGADRLFAARGAFALGFERAVILDAGTALTVDAYRAQDGRPIFLGGAITPGPALLADCLATGTARLPRVEPRLGVPALGRDTRGALEAGIVVGFRGAARELVQRISLEADLLDAPALLTGGAAPFLSDEELFPGRVLRVEPDLVHLGLLAAARAGARP